MYCSFAMMNLVTQFDWPTVYPDILSNIILVRVDGVSISHLILLQKHHLPDKWRQHPPRCLVEGMSRSLHCLFTLIPYPNLTLVLSSPPRSLWPQELQWSLRWSFCFPHPHNLVLRQHSDVAWGRKSSPSFPPQTLEVSLVFWMKAINSHRFPSAPCLCLRPHTPPLHFPPLHCLSLPLSPTFIPATLFTCYSWNRGGHYQP